MLSTKLCAGFTAISQTSPIVRLKLLVAKISPSNPASYEVHNLQFVALV